MGLLHLGALAAALTVGLSGHPGPASTGHVSGHPGPASAAQVSGHPGPASAGHVRGHPGPPSTGHVCPGTGSVYAVRATRLRCRVARSAVQAYLSSPTGCRSSSHCIQSGLAGDAPIIVDCFRTGRHVHCTVYVKRAHGPVHDPTLGGVRVPGRFARGRVAFRFGGRAQ